MTTVRDIVTRSLRRSNIIDAKESASGDDATNALNALNDLMYGLKTSNVDVLFEGFTLSQDFRFFVPPRPVFGVGASNGNAEGRLGVALNLLAYQGEWDASANSPTLTTGTGTQGHVYKVATAGSTTLDEVTSWAINDYALFDGYRWLKAPATGSRPFEGHIVAILGVRLCEDYGMQPGSVLARDADMGMSAILNHFIIPGMAQFDYGISRMPSQRYVDYY